jgi:hypothetical protein
MILAIDPGTTESGWAAFRGDTWGGGVVEASGVMPNEEIRQRLRMVDFSPWPNEIAIEMIASYGMPVGAEVFETCVWIGRFIEALDGLMPVRLIYRKDVKMHLCGTPRAKDANIRQALIDKIGKQGTKKSPGPTYGVKSHAWAALAVAVTAAGKP